MTAPIPLRSPDGVTYAYACGSCRHIADGGQLFGGPGPGAYTDEDVAYLAESSREDAEVCCVVPEGGTP